MSADQISRPGRDSPMIRLGMTAGTKLLTDLDGAAPLFAQWELATATSRMEDRVIPTRRRGSPISSCIRRGFALGNALGWVQIVDRQGLFAGLATRWI